MLPSLRSHTCRLLLILAAAIVLLSCHDPSRSSEFHVTRTKYCERYDRCTDEDGEEEECGVSFERDTALAQPRLSFAAASSVLPIGAWEDDSIVGHCFAVAAAGAGDSCGDDLLRV